MIANWLALYCEECFSFFLIYLFMYLLSHRLINFYFSNWLKSITVNCYKCKQWEPLQDDSCDP